MDDDRRSSLRRQVSLPFAWSIIEGPLPVVGICDALKLPRVLSLQSSLADHEAAFAASLAAVTDARLAEILRLLDARVALLTEALLAQAPVPVASVLELSADGIGFETDQPLQPGQWIGVHLVLPVSYHVVCLARVSRCAEVATGGYHNGAGFHDLDPPLERRLTRFVISRDRAAPA